MNDNTQLEHWNGPAGQKWVSYADSLDAMLSPLSKRLLTSAVVQEGERVLDIGCGSGALTIQANALAGPGVAATGIDISAPLVQLAKERATEQNSPAVFELSDAETYRAGQKFDLMVSRLGVMFFNDPLAAFEQIRRQAKSGGGLSFVCWQTLAKNEWLSVPFQAATPFFKELPQASGSDGPGPFSLANKDGVFDILNRSGWRDVTVSELDLPLTLPGTDSISSARLMIQMGPVAPIIRMQGLDAAPIEEAVADVLAKHQNSEGRISMGSSTWLVSASTV